jgi:hypothetical protein
MKEELPPPRVAYGFKPKEFERLNQPADASQGDANQPIDVRDIARTAGFTWSSPGGQSTSPKRENDVHAILRENRAREKASGEDEIRMVPRRLSRRKRDYIAGLVIGNAALVVGTVISPIFGAAGLIIFNCGFTWVVWFVMDDY